MVSPNQRRGGESLHLIGDYMIGADLLCIGGVSSKLMCPKDFAADNLAKTFVSYPTIEKVLSAKPQFGSTIEGDKGVTAMSLLFLHLHLHAVDGKKLPATHLAVHLWSSMLWVTSICKAGYLSIQR